MARLAKAFPKPFIRLADEESLFKNLSAQLRLPAVIEVLTITNREYYFKRRDECLILQQERPASVNFMLAPLGRNTAPAIAMGALKIAPEHVTEAMME